MLCCLNCTQTPDQDAYKREIGDLCQVWMDATTRTPPNTHNNTHARVGRQVPRLDAPVSCSAQSRLKIRRKYKKRLTMSR